MQLTITIDDSDRDQVPRNPWTAHLSDGCAVAGVGATAVEAVRDLLEGLDPEDFPEFFPLDLT